MNSIINSEQSNQKIDIPITIINNNNNNINCSSLIQVPTTNQLSFTGSSQSTNQDISNPSLFPNFENLQIPKEQVLSRKCKNHPYSTCNLIHLKATTEHPWICYICAQQQLIPHDELLLVSELLNSNKNSFLSTYPVLSDKSTIRNVKGLISCLEQKMEQIEEFFNELKETVLAAINKVQRSQKLHMNRLSELYQRTIDSFQEASNIEEFQSILLSKGQYDTEQMLKQFISDHCSKKEQNTAKINENYQEFNSFLQRFSLQKPNEVKEAVVDLLQSIEMFKGVRDDSGLENQMNVEKNQKIKKVKNKNQQQGGEGQDNKPKRQRKIQQNQQQQQQQPQQQENINDLNNNIIQLPKSLLNEVYFIPSSDYKMSQHYTQIDRLLNNHIKITNNDPTNNNFNNIQCFMQQVLVPSYKYIIQLKLNNISDFPPLIRFGLIEDDKKTKEYIGNNPLSYIETDGGSITKIIKGQQLHSGIQAKKIGEKVLEVRIYLEGRLFRIGNYPGYENVAEINNLMDIRQDKQYYFGMSIDNSMDSVCIQEVIIADNYDNQM